MKLLLLVLLTLMAFPAAAQEEQKGIMIVDGKKFFPLSGVRRHTEYTKPMPVSTEKKAGKSPVTIVPRRSAVTPRLPLQPAIISPVQLPPPPAASSAPKNASEQILSIFSPEESYSEKSAIQK